MIIMSSDDKRYIDVGSEGIWYSILSTAEIRLAPMKKSINLVLDFLHTGKCSAKNAHETARQFNLLRDALAQITPSNAVYDKENPSGAATLVALLLPAEIFILHRTEKIYCMKLSAY